MIDHGRTKVPDHISKKKIREYEGDLGSNPGPIDHQMLSPPLGHSHAFVHKIINNQYKRKQGLVLFSREKFELTNC